MRRIHIFCGPTHVGVGTCVLCSAGHVNATHGNTGGGGRDCGVKSLLAKDALEHVIGDAGVDYMPHNTPITVPFPKPSAMLSEITKVCQYCRCLDRKSVV